MNGAYIRPECNTAVNGWEAIGLEGDSILADKRKRVNIIKRVSGLFLHLQRRTHYPESILQLNYSMGVDTSKNIMRPVENSNETTVSLTLHTSALSTTIHGLSHINQTKGKI